MGYTADLCTGGTPISGGDRIGSSKSNAFDNNLSTIWQSSQSGSAVANVAYIGYQHTIGRKIKKIRHRSIFFAEGYSTVPAAVKAIASNDGVTWYDIQTGYTFSAYSSDTWHEFEITTSEVDYTQWTLKATGPVGLGYWVCAEIEMMEWMEELPIITVTNATRTKLGLVAGTTTSTVTFRSDTPLVEWEARAGGAGHGQGLLVGNGTTPLTEGANLVNADVSEIASAAIVAEDFNPMQSTLTYLSSGGYGGGSCLQVSPTAAESGFAFSNLSGAAVLVDGQAGDVYRLKVKYKGDAGTMTAGLMDYATFTFTDGQEVAVAASSEWVEYSVDITIPSAFTNAFPQIAMSGAETLWYVDVLELRKLTPGTPIPANTDITFDVETVELSQGDGAYQINVYGKNSAGTWSAYG